MYKLFLAVAEGASQAHTLTRTVATAAKQSAEVGRRSTNNGIAGTFKDAARTVQHVYKPATRNSTSSAAELPAKVEYNQLDNSEAFKQVERTGLQQLFY